MEQLRKPPDLIYAAGATTDPGRREALLREAGAVAPPRLTLTVDANGNPRLEFLDDKGLVTRRLPLKK